MEGITILEEHIINGPNLFGTYILITGFISFTVGVILLFTTFHYDEIGLTLFSLGTISILSGLFISCLLPGAPTDKAIYTIRVEERIDLNELLNNYEIVEHEKYSNIYKIKGDIIDGN